MTTKEKAQIGLSQLEDAIIEVLYKAKVPLQPNEISKPLGIPSLKGFKRKKINYYAIVHGVLVKLELEGRVKSVPSEKRSNTEEWQLTQNELSKCSNTN